MKRIFYLLIVIFVIGSCKKVEEKVKEEVGYSILTDGQWKVSSYQRNTEDLTGDFSGYLFQFKKNGTVDALKSGAVEKTGTWSTDASYKTITANYTAANATLTLLNGTWTFKDAAITFVIAVQESGGTTLRLRLDKQ